MPCAFPVFSWKCISIGSTYVYFCAQSGQIVCWLELIVGWSGVLLTLVVRLVVCFLALLRSRLFGITSMCLLCFFLLVLFFPNMFHCVSFSLRLGLFYWCPACSFVPGCVYFHYLRVIFAFRFQIVSILIWRFCVLRA